MDNVANFVTQEDKDSAAVVQALMRALEIVNERKAQSVVILLQDKNGGMDTIGTPIKDFFTFMGHYTQLEFKLRQGAEEIQENA